MFGGSVERVDWPQPSRAHSCRNTINPNMKRKPLFITLIVAVAVIGIVAVILFMKDGVKAVKSKATEPETEPEPEPEAVTETKPVQ